MDLGAMAMKEYSTFPKFPRTLTSDGLMSYPGYSLGVGSYPSAEMQSVYSTALVDEARIDSDLFRGSLDIFIYETSLVILLIINIYSPNLR